MGFIAIKRLRKEFLERRSTRRKFNGPGVEQGQPLLVLDEIDLECKDGELVCVLGPSGCGKSTLLRIMAGFDSKTSGSVTIDGREVNGPSSENIFVFQHNGLLPWLTVAENVGLGLRHWKDEKARDERVQEYIDIVNLSGFEQHYPHQLSGGMQRRAELARALVVSPEVMFMDEPFAGLDYLTRLKMQEEIINMHEYFRKTVVFITHDIDEAMTMGDRVVVMSERPARVKLDVELTAPHPRDFLSDPELSELRKSVYHELGVHHAL